MATIAPDQSRALAVLKETIKQPRPAGAFMAQSTGARLVSVLGSTGWQGTQRRLTTEQIIQLAAVIICLDVLSQDISKVTFRMYERLPENGKRELEVGEHKVADLLKSAPNRFHTWQEFFEMTMLHLGLAQNAFIAKRQTTEGRVLELIPCMPARTRILAVAPEDDPMNGLGFYCYEVTRNTTHEKIQLAKLPEVFLQDEFIHFRARMFDGLMGYSNLEAGAKVFGMASELADYQTRIFASDGQFPGVFQMGEEAGDSISEAAFERLRDQLAEAVRKMRDERRPIVLEEGMTFEQIAMNAEQAQLKDSRDAAVVDVARFFRIPPHKIMHLINVKYENMETLEKSYVFDTLIPYCHRIEQRMARSLLTREEQAKYFFEFDRIEMLLTDQEKLADSLKVLIQNGAISRDEARRMFGMNILAGKAGKTYLIPSTYNLVDETNKVVVPAGAQPQGGDEEPGAKKPAKPKKEADDAVSVD